MWMNAKPTYISAVLGPRVTTPLEVTFATVIQDLLVEGTTALVGIKQN